MNNRLTWQSDIVDWEKIGVDSYKFVLKQANERLSEVIEESQAITKRGMTILLSHIAALSGILGYLFSDKSRISHERGWPIIIICFMALLSIVAFIILTRLIYPKVFFNRGSPPKEIFFKEVFDDLTEEEGLKSILFDEVVRMQNKIEKMEKANNKRIVPFKITLNISLVFIAFAIFMIVKTIYN